MGYISEASSFKIVHSNFRVVLYPSMIDSRACKTNGPLTLSKKSFKMISEVFKSIVQRDLLMKEHVASFASVSLRSPHEFLKEIYNSQQKRLETLPEQYSQKMGSLRNVPTSIWPLFSLVLFFLNFFLFMTFRNIVSNKFFVT